MPGRHGFVGKPGHQGPPGPKGPKGYPGQTKDCPACTEFVAEQGDMGHKGEPGERGPVGYRGPTGPPGDDAKCMIGKPGMKGMPGEPGPDGVKGHMGPPGPPGEQGSRKVAGSGPRVQELLQYISDFRANFYNCCFGVDASSHVKRAIEDITADMSNSTDDDMMSMDNATLDEATVPCKYYVNYEDNGTCNYFFDYWSIQARTNGPSW